MEAQEQSVSELATLANIEVAVDSTGENPDTNRSGLTTEPADSPSVEWLPVANVNFDSNPHLRQLRYLKQERCQMFTLETLERVLPPDAPRLPYQRTNDQDRSVIHWGQRKLLLSEIEFLTLYQQPNALVVYAGAAPGTHCNYLSTLFPELRFLLVDPNKFNATESPQISIRQEFFTELICEELAKTEKAPILFISDIRTADPKKLGAQEVERAVSQDMTLQMNWHLLLKPRASMLKFRLPWSAGITPYLDGKIFLPVWGRETTTECRLIAESDSIRDYDNTVYEQQMFYFNRLTRVQYHSHGVIGVPGMDACYDCAAEVKILYDYQRQRNSHLSHIDLLDAVSKMSIELNGHCSTIRPPRTLAFQESREQRQNWFAPTKFNYETRTLEIDAKGRNRSRGGGNRSWEKDRWGKDRHRDYGRGRDFTHQSGNVPSRTENTSANWLPSVEAMDGFMDIGSESGNTPSRSDNKSNNWLPSVDAMDGFMDIESNPGSVSSDFQQASDVDSLRESSGGVKRPREEDEIEESRKRVRNASF